MRQPATRLGTLARWPGETSSSGCRAFSSFGRRRGRPPGPEGGPDRPRRVAGGRRPRLTRVRKVLTAGRRLSVRNRTSAAPTRRTRRRTSYGVPDPDRMGVIANLPEQADANESPRSGDRGGAAAVAACQAAVAPISHSSAESRRRSIVGMPSTRTQQVWTRLWLRLVRAPGSGDHGDGVVEFGGRLSRLHWSELRPRRLAS
jgi:hypothetical protein